VGVEGGDSLIMGVMAIQSQLKSLVAMDRQTPEAKASSVENRGIAHSNLLLRINSGINMLGK
jgi:hypothetical protein